MSSLYLKLQNAMNDRREDGQGTIEYLGIAVVIAIVVIAVASWFSSTGNSSITDALNNIIEQVSGRFAGEG
ncbi:hypothetical protein [Nesterenkonia sp.]|uniref:hypothetical protein n=1 Tax=Nesterenkonia sp. TaxID=704201 RepID=UPI00261F678F|nr:hypothetical protein [Nesterenkonia sp.]